MTPTPSAQYSLTIRVEIADEPGMLGKVATAIGAVGGTIGDVDLTVETEGMHLLRNITVETPSPEEWGKMVEAIDTIPGARVVETTDLTFALHRGGKIETTSKSPLKTRAELSMAYTPGVARVCNAIHEDPDKAFEYTIKKNTVA